MNELKLCLYVGICKYQYTVFVYYFFVLYNSVLGIRVQSPVAGLSRSCLSPACNLEMEFRSLRGPKK